MRKLLLTAGSILVLALAVTKPWWRQDGSADRTPRELAASMLAAYVSSSSTAGEVVGAPLFTDVARAAGLVFDHDNAARGNFYLPEEMGPGAGFLDYDGDGDLDVFIAGGGNIARDVPPQRCRLFRNDDGRFTDVSDASGAGIDGHAFGVACADIDNDGDVDVLVTRLGANAFLRNEGEGRFVEVAAEIGLDDPGFGASATFFDFDRDGFLDLYVANYVRWSIEHARPCYTILGARDYCNPNSFEPEQDRLYRNRGNGTFEDVTEASGVGGEAGNGLGVVASDFDNDGFPDLFVANDQTAAMLWHNNADGTFENIALLNGCAFDVRGVAIAGMGIACEDLDADGDFDLLVTNIHDQTHILFENEGGFFVDVSQRVGLGQWSTPATTFGVAVFDQDHDGELDGFFANGEVNVDNRMPVSDNPYAQPDQFARFRDGKLVEASAEAGIAFADVGRGVAFADYDDDGDLDLLLTNNGGPARLFRNNSDSSGAWCLLDVRTRGRSAIGARITLTAGNRRWVREVRPQQSYLTSSDPRVHFGLGDVTRIEDVTIRWPDGSTSSYTNLPVNQVHRLAQDEGGTGG